MEVEQLMANVFVPDPHFDLQLSFYTFELVELSLKCFEHIAWQTDLKLAAIITLNLIA